MDDAPKDGTEILVCEPRYQGHPLGKFIYAIVAWTDADGWEDSEGYGFYPTHWHPLEPPA